LIGETSGAVIAYEHQGLKANAKEEDSDKEKAAAFEVSSPQIIFIIID
jgi:hypothetical protein